MEQLREVSERPQVEEDLAPPLLPEASEARRPDLARSRPQRSALASSLSSSKNKPASVEIPSDRLCLPAAVAEPSDRPGRAVNLVVLVA